MIKDPVDTDRRPFLEGTRVYLRGVHVSDVGEAYGRWMQDPEVLRYTESRFRPHTPESLAEYVRSVQADARSVFLAIVLKADRRHIGNIKLGPIDWVHRVADLAILIGEKDCWGQGIATEAIRLVADHAFRVLNLHKLTAGCYAANAGSLRAFKKAGFVEEGVRRQHYFLEGAYVDAHLLGLVSPCSAQ